MLKIQLTLPYIEENNLIIVINMAEENKPTVCYMKNFSSSSNFSILALFALICGADDRTSLSWQLLSGHVIEHTQTCSSTHVT